MKVAIPTLNIRQRSDLFFSLTEYAKDKYQLHFGFEWTRKLGQSVDFTRDKLCDFKHSLSAKQTTNIHLQHRLLRHSITVRHGAYTEIELSRNLLLFDMVLIDESFSERLFAEDVAALIEWLTNNGF